MPGSAVGDSAGCFAGYFSSDDSRCFAGEPNCYGLRILWPCIRAPEYTAKLPQLVSPRYPDALALRQLGDAALGRNGQSIVEAFYVRLRIPTRDAQHLNIKPAKIRSFRMGKTMPQGILHADVRSFPRPGPFFDPPPRSRAVTWSDVRGHSATESNRRCF
jgi:hypothetical protein